MGKLTKNHKNIGKLTEQQISIKSILIFFFFVIQREKNTEV